MVHRRPFLLGLPALPIALAVAGAHPAPDLRGGAAAQEAYIRAVATHFQVPLAEVQVLADWNLPLEEVPVVLFVSQRSGVSSDALIAVRRGGASWMSLVQRYGLDAGVFHFPLEQNEAGALLGDVEARFRSASPAQWGGIRLSDQEVIALVNVRFLAQALRVPPGRVVEARMRTGDFVETHAALRPSR